MSDFSTTQRKWSHLEVAQLLISRTAMTELSLDDAKKVVQRMHTVAIKEGTVLVQEGSSSNSNYMLLILNGEAVVENEGLKKKDSLILGVVGTGHIIGEMGLLDGEARSATCTASSDMDVAVLDSNALAQLIETEPTTSCKLLAALLQRTSNRLRATNGKLRVLTQINRTLEEEISSLGRGQHPQAKPVAHSDNPLMF
ncbi:MAG: cyclic nucleotide-binding domain-containing protein [Pseudomonadota bacterium]